MPQRPHPVLLTALVAACMFVALLFLPGAIAHARPTTRTQASVSRPHADFARHAALTGPDAPLHRAPRADWRWPLHGPLVGRFRVTPGAPYARGQRRGIDLAAPPGTEVRAACAGRVTFAGSLPRFGRAVGVRCGALIATYLRLARIKVSRGGTVAPGQPLGTLSAAGALRLGARRAADRRAYLDPLTLLHDPDPRLPVLGPGPPSRPPAIARRPRPHTPHPRLAPERPHAAPRRLPWPAYPALALIATAVPVGGLVRLRRRSRRAPSAATAR